MSSFLKYTGMMEWHFLEDEKTEEPEINVKI